MTIFRLNKSLIAFPRHMLFYSEANVKLFFRKSWTLQASALNIHWSSL